MQTEISSFVRNRSYRQVISNPHTDLQRNIVRATILEHPSGITDIEICIITGISRSSVTARRNEIPDVIPVGIAKIVDESGDRMNTLWGINGSRGETPISTGSLKGCDAEDEKTYEYMG